MIVVVSPGQDDPEHACGATRRRAGCVGVRAHACAWLCEHRAALVLIRESISFEQASRTCSSATGTPCLWSAAFPCASGRRSARSRYSCPRCVRGRAARGAPPPPGGAPTHRRYGSSRVTAVSQRPGGAVLEVPEGRATVIASGPAPAEAPSKAPVSVVNPLWARVHDPAGSVVVPEPMRAGGGTVGAKCVAPWGAVAWRRRAVGGDG